MRRAFVVLVVIAALFYGAVTFRALEEMARFRAHPTIAVAARLLRRSDWPHDVAARTLMFKPGTDTYQDELRRWSFRFHPSDTFPNRWLLEREAARMSPVQRNGHMPRYPFAPSAEILPILRDALYSGAHGVIPVLNRAPGGQLIYGQWVQEVVIDGQRGDAFVDAAKYIMAEPPLSPNHLLSQMWPHLDERQRDGVLRTADRVLGADSRPLELLTWVSEELSSQQGEMRWGMARLLGRLAGLEPTSDATRALAVRELDAFTPDDAASLFYHGYAPGDFSWGWGYGMSDAEQAALARALFTAADTVDPAVALVFFHALCHASTTDAEAAFKPYLVQRCASLFLDCVGW